MAAKVFYLAALAAVARAHVIMTLPVPFDVANLNNSPLDASGSDFPCKNPIYTNVGTMNEYTIGGKGELQFIGTAVHGGGSCQVSVTYDNPPTTDSTWKVIKSFEGGCPSRGAVGNLEGNSADLPNPDTYDFEMPAIPSGEAILAWTWFNKIGNREMYMNCAPITISGSGSAEYYQSLPDMFKANIASETECVTVADTDLQFPDPGSVLEYDNEGTTAFGTAGSCSSTSNTHPDPSEVPSGGDDTATTTSAAPPVETTAAPPVETTAAPPVETTAAPPVETTAPAETAAPPAETSAASQPPASIPGGVFLPNPSKSSDAETPAATTPAATTPATSTPTKAPTTGNSGNTETETETDTDTDTDANTSGSACTDEGLFLCIGGTQFQRCASGTWSEVQDLAAGTGCTPGATASFSVSAVSPA